VNRDAVMSPHIFRYEVSPDISVHLECTGILHSSRSEYQRIEVVESIGLGRMLVLDGVINLTERDEYIYHEMLTHVPLFSHPNPSHVLIVGGGDGGTAREVVKHGSVEKIQQVEIDREVIRVSKKYFPSLGGALDNPKVNVLVTDAVPYIAQTREKFDVIIIDSTDPGIKQSEGLFTTSFYTDCRNALTETGVFAAQVGDISFETNLVENVFRNLRKAFPVVKAYLAPIPSYSILPYSFAYCANTVLPEKGLGPARFSSGFETRYYNPRIHCGAFALPEYLRTIFEP
jgi:spermidine synthase